MDDDTASTEDEGPRTHAEAAMLWLDDANRARYERADEGYATLQESLAFSIAHGQLALIEALENRFADLEGVACPVPDRTPAREGSPTKASS